VRYFGRNPLASGDGMRSKLSSYMVLTISSGLAQGFLLLISPIITRLYGPQEVGAFALILGFGALVGSVGTGRLEHAIPIAHGPIEAIRIAFLGGVLVTATSLIVLVVINVLPMSMLPGSASWKGLPFLAVPVIAISFAFSQLINALLLRQRAIKSVGKNKILQGVVSGVGQLAFGLAQHNAAGMIWAQAIGYMVGAMSGLRRLSLRGWMVIWHRGARLGETFIEYKRFPFTLAPAALCNLAAQQVPILALTSIYGLYEAGLYALIMRACGGPLGMLGQAVAQVYASEFRAIRDKPEGALSREYLVMLFRLAIVGVFAVGALVIVMNAWGTTIFGKRWENIGIVSTLLSLMLFSDFVTTPVSMTLSYLGRTHIQLIWDAGRLLALLIAAALTYWLSLRFGQFMVLLATVWSFSLFIHAVLTWQACRASGRTRTPDNGERSIEDLEEL
jgi:O-antigen/teichoic acid export membrane protein